MGEDDSIRTANIPNVLDSSDNSDEETLSSSFQDRTFQNILAVLVGRQSLDFSSLRRGYQQETSSDSDSDEGQSWLYQPQPAPPQPQPPDIREIEKAEIAIHTKQSLGIGSRRGQLKLPGIIVDRSLCGQFSVRDKRLICSNLLPHNHTKVAQYKNKVFCGTHTRDGDIFMTACQDRKLRIYDTARHNFKLKQTIEARDVGWSILDVAVSPDGEHLVYSSWSDNLHQISLLDHEEKHDSLPL